MTEPLNLGSDEPSPTEPSVDWKPPSAQRDRQSITSDGVTVGHRQIDGVRVREIRNVLTGYGSLVEIYRADWQLDAEGVGQVFQSVLSPGKVSAWHAHESSTDRLFVSAGRLLVVLTDMRRDSPTFGVVNEFRFGGQRPAIIVVPPQIWHGVQNISHEPSTLINVVDKAYSYDFPDHWRLPLDSPALPYRFSE